MKPSALSSLSVLSLLTGTLALVGCGAAASFSNPTPPASTVPPTTAQVVAGPAVEGSVYGGHTPIQGSHVYLLTPGITGYGSLATSLLGTGTTTSPGGYALTADVNDPNVPVGSQYVTSDANGAFSFTGAYVCTVGQPVYVYSYGGKISTTGVFNDNIVQLLTLGNCPSSGSFSPGGTGALNYVYLNEVSTVATAYTFQPFTLATNNDAWHIGTTNTTQGLLGIANAANTAAQLYNIQGGTQLSTAHSGEGHIANYATIGGTTANRGNGVVPQSTIDSLANILADCVDSTPVTQGLATTQCSSLLGTATNNGELTGTTSTPDTGTAMINIARFPAGNHSAGTLAVDAAYVTDVYSHQATGGTPYIPQLSAAPHDWTLAINYPVTAVPGYTLATNSTLGLAESVAIDNIGQVWVTAQTGSYINRYTNLGVNNSLDLLNYITGYVSIDGSNNAWTGNANCAPGNTACPDGTPIFEGNVNGVGTNDYGSGYQQAYTVITNNAGDAFFFAKVTDTGATNTGGNYGMFEYDPGGNLVAGSPFNITTTTTTAPGPVTQNLTISAASETNTGGAYTYSFNYAYAGGTPTTLLAVGDTVPLTLANDPGTGAHPVAATGWPALTSVTVASVSGTSFTATGTTPTTNSNDGNGATTTAPITITAATETKSGGGTYTYTFDFTNVGTPGAVLAVGDTVPLSLTNDPGTGSPATAATGWTGLTTVKVATVNNTANPTSFTATGGTTGTANITTTNTNDSAGPVTETFNITKSTETHAGATYTYTFTINGANTPTILVAGDKVKVNLANSGGGGGWTGLNTVTLTVTNPNSATNPTSFQATGTVATTDGGGNSANATGTGSFTLNGATGTGSYAYTNANGATGTGSYVYTGTITTTTPGVVLPGDNVAHGAIDSTGDLWVTAESGYTIGRVTPTGTPAFPMITVTQQPEFPAIDGSGNAWIPGYESNSVYVVSPTGTLSTLTSTSTGAAIVYPFGSAVDGNGNVWITNRCGPGNNCAGPLPNSSTLVEINGGVSTPGTANTAISPATNYVPEAEYSSNPSTETNPAAYTKLLPDPLNLAIDSSGNIWITNYVGTSASSSLVEIIGAAAPVVTPLSVAAGTNSLGAKP